ncbi:MAG: hypothetical protein JXB04_05080 [Kiritimatiellae bacterium]|nr:hypothetical protein [Kiritimatiellia bacterium]
MIAVEHIVVCEPQFKGFEHSAFNAALLEAVLAGWPGVEITFVAEPGHASEVGARLAEQELNPADQIRWQERRNVPRSRPYIRRAGREMAFCLDTLRTARRTRARMVLFASVTPTLLMAVKWALRILPVAAPVLAIPHDILGDLKKKATGLGRRLMSLSNVLREPWPRNLKLVVLGAFILRNIEQDAPEVSARFAGMDQPFLWPVPAPAAGRGAGPLRFGYLGVSAKGLRGFVELAQAVQRERPGGCEFTMVGFVNRPEDDSFLDPTQTAVTGLARAPLSRTEYVARGRSLTYAVWTAPAESYRLRASTAFLDGLSFVKPGICLRNDCLDNYFDRMGDIGYLCEDFDAMRDVILSIIDDFPSERYEAQCKNILAGRNILTPETVGPALRRIAEGVAGSA